MQPSQDKLPPELALPAKPRILVITLRRLGDVLMSTPLLRTIRRRWPEATLHTLLFAGSERIIKGNPDLDEIITVPPRPDFGQMRALARKLGRSYDLAVSTQSGDRPTLYAIMASRRRVGLVPLHRGGIWWKRPHARPAGPGRPRLPSLRGNAAPGQRAWPAAHSDGVPAGIDG